MGEVKVLQYGYGYGIVQVNYFQVKTSAPRQYFNITPIAMAIVMDFANF